MKSAGDNRHGGWIERLVANDSCADGSIRLYLDGWLLTTHTTLTHIHTGEGSINLILTAPLEKAAKI